MDTADHQADAERDHDRPRSRRGRRDGAITVLVPRDGTGGWWYAIIHRDGRVGTLMRASKRYVERERSRSRLLREGSGEAVAEGRP